MKFKPGDLSELSEFATQAPNFETEAQAPRGRTLSALALTLLLVAVAAALRVMYFDELGRNTRYLIFYPAVTLAALYGGLFAGVLATALSAAIAHLLVVGGAPSSVDPIATVIFLLSGALISLIAEGLRRSKTRVRARHDETLAANAQLLRQLRLYEGLSKCIAEIASAASQADLFNNICRLAVATADMKLAWIGAADDDGWVRPLAAAGPAIDYLADIQISIDKSIPAGRGPTGIAIRENRAVWSLDFLINPAMEPWQRRGLRFGLRSSTALPICVAGKAEYALMIYSDSAGTFMSDVQRLLTNLADALGVALTKFRAEAQRSAAQREAIAAERRLRVSMDNMLEGCMIVDRDWRFLYINDIAARHLHQADRPALGASLLATLAESSAAEVAAGLRQVMLERNARSFEARIAFANGAAWYRFSVAPVPEGIFVMSLDISESKSNEARMKDTAERHRAILETAMDGFWMADTQGRLLEVNRAYCLMSGYRRKELLGMRIQDLEAVETADEIAAHIRVAEARGHDRFESQHRRKDGSVYEVEVSVQFQAADNGRFVVFLRDITERKRVEAALQDYRRHLERLVEERTASLSLARDAAEAANRAKSTFLASMSHEIRTPLNAISGMARLIRRSGVPAEQVERLDNIVAAGQHLSAIINDILDLARIEEDKLKLNEKAVDLDRIVGDAVRMLKDRAQAKNIELRIDSVQRLPPLRGDATRLEQALVNYLTNAIKFTETGSVTVRVRGEEDTGDSVLVRFEVQDTGLGIAESALPRLFTAFEQIDASGTHAQGGSGLGLAITRRLAQMMGGEAGVHSGLGKGSTFWFTARLSKSTLAEANAAPDGSAVDKDAIGDPRGRRVLVAEDDAINREVAISLLNEVGLSVDCAEDGVQAVDLAGRNSYDLILMDVQMPRLDGLDATRQIRRLPHAEKIPIIAMTAHAFEEDRTRCADAGMNDHIAKPIEPEIMWATIRRWLKPAAEEPAVTQNPPLAPPADKIETIAGLDVAVGLRMATGDVAWYRKLLGLFVSSEQDTTARIAQAIACANWREAERLAHRLRGAAAQIGAHGLRDLAFQLEQAIGERAPLVQILAAHAMIAQGLGALLEALAAYHSPPAQTEAAGAVKQSNRELQQ